MVDDKTLPRSPVDQDNPDTPKLYINGFFTSLGTGDVMITLLLNNNPVQQLQMSYTLAKTLGLSINQAISALEEATGNEIMTTHFVENKLQILAGEDNNAK